MVRIAIVAGEASGDLLGAGLIRAIKARNPEACFEGIAGPEMVKAGCNALHTTDKLSVMGLVEVLARYRELRSIRNGLIARFVADPPDIFVGIDAPDFNLGIEHKLKQAGIPTVHYVSPTVWAWRRYRVRKVARAVDLMLTLFPFEADFYQQNQVPVRFVGHPLADMMPLRPDPRQARETLGLPLEGELMAMLPGSRLNEVRMLAKPFLDTAAWCLARRPGLRFAVPLASDETAAEFKQIADEYAPELPLTLVPGGSRRVLEASDVVLSASGTATLEGLLLKRPMVVAYRLAGPSYWLIRRLVKLPYFALPNLLAGQKIIEEFIQQDAQPDKMGAVLLEYLTHPEAAQRLHDVFGEIHQSLRQDANKRAADEVLRLVGDPP